MGGMARLVAGYMGIFQMKASEAFIASYVAIGGEE